MKIFSYVILVYWSKNSLSSNLGYILVSLLMLMAINIYTINQLLLRKAEKLKLKLKLPKNQVPIDFATGL